MSTRSILYWLIASVLAVFAAAASLASALTREAPAFAAQITPAGGLAYDRLAGALARAGFTVESGVEPATLPEEAVNFAHRAFASEPYATAAVRVLAYDLLRDGDKENGRRLMRAVAQMTKRDEAVGMWMVQDAIANNDKGGAIAQIDLVMRSSEKARQGLVPVLVELLDSPEAVPVFYDLLAKSPPWAGQFWLAAAEDEDALVNAAELRQRLLRSGTKFGGSSDQKLIYALVAQGEVTRARALADGFFGRSDRLLTNGDFGRATKFAPFDWGLVAAQNYGAAIDTQQGKLAVSATADAGGVVASQLVQLAPGRYTLSLKGEGLALYEEPVAALAVRCISGGAPVINEVLESDQARFQFSVEPGGCGDYWIEIVARSVSLPNGYDFRIDQVDLDPVS